MKTKSFYAYTILIVFVSFCMNASWHFPFFPSPKPPFRVMINPTGDAQHTGRTIGDSFERALTLGIAQAVKQEIELLQNDITITIARTAGQATTQAAIASYANRAGINLFINISVYQETTTKPYCTLYRFSYSQDFITKHSALEFIPCTHASIRSSSISKSYAALISHTLRQEASEQSIQFQGPFSLPYKPLLGITAPALGFEIGVKDSRQLNHATQALIKSILSVYEVRA